MGKGKRKPEQEKEFHPYREYTESPEKVRKLYRRTLSIVVLSQIFGGAGLAAGITVGALIAREMLGTDSMAGLPTALFTLGAALSALIVGRLSQRSGRRFGLAGGFLAGALGAVGVITATMLDSIWLLFAALFIYGAGSATNLQVRYAGTDLAGPKQRATAVSIALVSTTVGAVAGPNLVGVMGEFASSVGVPPLAGPFILAAVAYLAAGLILLTLLKPDPLLVANALETRRQAAAAEKGENVSVGGTYRRGVIAGATVMVVTQLIMTGVMTMTPVHMEQHGHALSAVGSVIGVHIALMYLPSLLTGILVDRVGRNIMAAAAGVTLLAAGAVGAYAPPDSLFGLYAALGLLGLGWNFGLISGTAMIVDATAPSVRAKTQGSVDVLIALSGATGGMLSGVIAAYTGFGAMALGGGILSLLLIPVVVWSLKGRGKQVAV
ncbi:MFS transporter [Bhargavaea ginsengi]|uniref:MFS transporter n=1 Tax=Bhargavaea ginsengi TaxID=426757 RepID=UPI00203BBA83|nr:MFS transporter [Bhargavaea ginsengi]MCM3088469.1 MFS transporter [Bhargavaea ginsengi]